MLRIDAKQVPWGLIPNLKGSDLVTSRMCRIIRPGFEVKFCKCDCLEEEDVERFWGDKTQNRLRARSLGIDALLIRRRCGKADEVQKSFSDIPNLVTSK